MAEASRRPTRPFCIGACPPSTSAGTRVPLLRGAIRGPTHGAARGACAQVRAPPPPPHPQPRTSRARAPQVEPPPRAGGAPAPPCARTSPAGRAETRRPSMEPRAGLRGPPPAPPRRQRQVRVHRARPVPNLPPPGSQRHVTTGAAEGQSPARRPRPGGGAAGSAARGLLPGFPGERPGGVRLRRHGDPRWVSATCRSSSFSTLCPSGGRAAAGDRVAGPRTLDPARPHRCVRDSEAAATSARATAAAHLKPVAHALHGGD